MTFAVLATLIVGTGLAPLVLRMMRAASILDVPSQRSSHTVTTPRGGGVAVVAAVVAGVMLIPAARPLAVPVLLCALIGLADDVRGMPVVVRLGGLLAVGLAAGASLAPGTGGPAVRMMVGVVVAVWLTAFVNAFNFMDGVNGISALFATVAGTAYAVLGTVRHLPLLTGAGAVVAAAALTFLPWNAVRARIFLGDVGSYGLGAALGIIAAYAVGHGVAVEVALAPLSVYLADTGYTLLRRLARGENWWQAHRTHVYQRLTDVGWSHTRVAVLVCALAVLLSVLAPLGSGLWPRLAVDAAGLTVLIGYLMSPGLAARLNRRTFDRRVREREEELYV